MEPYKNSLLSRFLCDFTQIWRLFRNLFVLLGFCPSALASLLLFCCCQKDEIIFHLLQTVVCLFVRYQNRKNTRITNERKREKENNKKE